MFDLPEQQECFAEDSRIVFVIDTMLCLKKKSRFVCVHISCLFTIDILQHFTLNLTMVYF